MIRKAYRFRLKPTAEQAVQFGCFAGCCRLVWNKALELQKKQLDNNAKLLSYAGACGQLVALKAELPFLKEVHSQPLQQTLKDQSLALKAALGGSKGIPRYKKKGKHDSFRFPQGTKVRGSKVYLPKIGWVNFIQSQQVEGKIKNVTVSRHLDHWYVAIQVELEIPDPVHPSESMVGIDMGVVKLAALSDGTVVAPVNSFGKLKSKIKKEQRKLSRKHKLSGKWQKQKRKVQKVHSKIANVRRDYLHKVTTAISNNHAIVVIEDLKVKNMSASAKGTIEQPGKNVKAKSGLNRVIQDQAWYEFRRQLEYKLRWKGGQLVVVSPVNTSLTCSKCNHKAKENRVKQEEFRCVECHHEENADLNAAKNILAAGRAVLAHGDIEQIAA